MTVIEIVARVLLFLFALFQGAVGAFGYEHDVDQPRVATLMIVGAAAMASAALFL